ncbi:hypothetical protein C380_08835 [Acidovorax sp. KKS102]|uniref:hypothetical protein n=1 Tax=Acidovorax sp. KKS102 TaxID=358220 RepID=UPI00028A63E1|nr:hypothetical protein [Acidovorax sp. KKS102]AFU45469.1 hypothetical protein C380_08835 [Acidovorax sp. KKS102]
MNLRNHNWTDLQGDPITGRAPPRLVVMNDVRPTPGQMGMVAHHYQLMTYALKVSIIPYMVQERTLTDGTRIRMVSNYGQDTVFVWPAGGGDVGVELAHGFCVEGSWISPQIIGKEKTVYNVAQARNGIVGGAHYAEDMKPDRLGDTGINVYPLVATGEAGKPAGLWDFKHHPGLSGAIKPVALKYGGKPLWQCIHPAHFSDGKTIRNAKNTALVTTALSTTATGDNPTEVTVFPLTMDNRGNAGLFQVLKKESVGLGSTFFSVARQAVTRTGKESYSLGGAATTEFWHPLPVAADDAVANFTNLVDDIDANLSAISITRDDVPFTSDTRTFGTYQLTLTGGFGWEEYPPGNVQSVGARQNMTEKVVPLNILSVGAGGDASRTITTPHKSAPQQIPIIAVSNCDGTEEVQYTHDICYPVSGRLIFGNQTYGYGLRPWGASSIFPQYNAAGYGVTSEELARRECHHIVDVSNSAEFDFGWAKLRSFEGTTVGGMVGFKQSQRLYKEFSSYYFAYSLFDSPNIPGELPAQQQLPSGGSLGDIYTTADIYSSTIDSSDQNPRWAGIRDQYVADNAKPAEETERGRENTLDYDYTSRFVIDYDHKSRFIAAIKVRVTCSGARWTEPVGSTIPGKVALSTPGDYTYTISFEANWNGNVINKQLLFGECTREPFEAFKTLYPNVYLWPSIAMYDPINAITVYTAPQVNPTVASFKQLQNIGTTQDTNPHFAAQDVETLGGFAGISSSKNIEFSRMENGREYPHHKTTTGLRYSRTFKISELSGATWLLDMVQAGVSLTGANDGSYEWMPAFRDDLINKVFTVEILDGEFVDWSADLQGALDTTVRPPVRKTRPINALLRNIKINRV